MSARDRETVKSLCKRIKGGGFAWERYQDGGSYRGLRITTMRTVSSAGLDGFVVLPEATGGGNLPARIAYDMIREEVLVDDRPFSEWYNDNIQNIQDKQQWETDCTWRQSIT